MASKSADIQKLRRILAGYPAAQARAFLQAVLALKNAAARRVVIRALIAGDVEQVVAALGLDAASFTAYSEGVRTAFTTGGALAAAQIPAAVTGKVRLAFNMSNPRAAEWLAQNTGKLLVDSYMEEMREAVRQTVNAGFARGDHPNNIARAIIGNASGTGGALGLAPNQARYVASMADRLASTNTTELRKVLKMVRRDKRFDHHILKAINDGTSIPVAVRNKMLERYEARLLKLRAETVARTETAMAVMGSRQVEWEEVLNRIGARPEDVIKRWRHGGGVNEARPDHEAMNGQTVRGLYTPFVMPDGTRLMHAHDVNGGAKHNANCSCDTLYSLDHSVGLT